MSNADVKSHEESGPSSFPERTFWERFALTQWGRYLSRLEAESIGIGQTIAGEPGVALEIGCEGGRWSRSLASLGWQVICTDVSGDDLAICSHRIPSAKCIRVRPEDTVLPCDSAVVQLLLCIEVPVIATQWFLGEARRVLVEGGILVCTAFNSRSHRAVLHKLLRKANRKGSDDGAYQVSYTQWKSTLRKKGFEVINERGACWFPFSRSSNSCLIPFCASLEKYLGLLRLTALSPWIMVVARKI